MQATIPASPKPKCWADISDTSSSSEDSNFRSPFVYFEDVGRVSQYRSGFVTGNRSYLNIMPNWSVVKRAREAKVQPWCLIVGSQKTFQNFVHWINHSGLWDVFGEEGLVHLHSEEEYDDWIRIHNAYQL
uniref:GIY-YIG nuclease subunit SLX1 n=1 Tax=Clandestinovirus TaxID=2831644 RepID=A0A8F8KPM0_9VIRU|nr:GIY-YIG nuclease subunit SLX1 [Clandestinovirus]